LLVLAGVKPRSPVAVLVTLTVLAFPSAIACLLCVNGPDTLAPEPFVA
jgi:hypothetical protein